MREALNDVGVEAGGARVIDAVLGVVLDERSDDRQPPAKGAGFVAARLRGCRSDCREYQLDKYQQLAN